MTFLAMALGLLALQPGWTWTLYEGEGPVVLAQEVPDTPRLNSVLECVPGSGVARLDLHGANQSAGVASLTSGPASASTPAERTADGLALSVRSDHPVFGQFVLSGALTVDVAGRSRVVDVPAGHLAKLRRFAELCGG